VQLALSSQNKRRHTLEHEADFMVNKMEFLTLSYLGNYSFEGLRTAYRSSDFSITNMYLFESYTLKSKAVFVCQNFDVLNADICTTRHADTTKNDYCSNDFNKFCGKI